MVLKTRYASENVPSTAVVAKSPIVLRYVLAEVVLGHRCSLPNVDTSERSAVGTPCLSESG
jgi:hypothetical protein